MYRDGIGVEQNMLKAVGNYQVSADLGNAEAAYQLGMMYFCMFFLFFFFFT